MVNKKKVPINYTSRDFNSIKKDLVEYAKRYYPDTFRDFSEASFGSLMIDTVSYVGDILSFYLDYQVNESFLDTSIEYNNIVRQGKQMGYKFRGATTSYGTCAFFIKVPANSTGLGPDSNYIPTLKKGAVVSSTANASFILTEDLDFNDESNVVVVAETNTTTGLPTTYAIRAFGRIASGEMGTETVKVGTFERFKKIRLTTPDIVELVSVTDAEGHRYYEVDYLSQDVIYRNVVNRKARSANEPAAILKPFAVPRRFVVDRTRTNTFLQFGYGSDSEMNKSSVVDPTDIVLQQTGRDYVSATSFDPSKLLDSDKFGIAPSNTTLTIRFRRNSAGKTNATEGSVTNVGRYLLKYRDPSVLTADKKGIVDSSLEVANLEPIVGNVSNPARDQLKQTIAGVYAAQNRAVTEQDYKSLVYAMPPQFGGITRCSIYRDSDSFKRNLNLYVISEDNNGKLTKTNSTIKENLKTWLSQNKMINDTIDILDAKIVNIEINYNAIASLGVDKFDALSTAANRLKELFSNKLDVGEPFNISQIYNTLNKTPGISDVTNVRIVNKFGGKYSNIGYDINDNTTPDGRYINVPKNVILEIKFPNVDIKGTIK
jgi:hypothetical protein